MIWYLCLAICLVTMGIVGKIALSKRLGTMRILYVMLGCVVVSYAVYIPAFFLELPFSAALMGNVINVIHVITAEADYLMTYEILQVDPNVPEAFKHIYYVFLGFVHILLPTVSAMTAITVIMKCVTQLRLRIVRNSRKPLYVFSEVNYSSRTLAADIRKNDPYGDILFLEEDNDADHSELQETLHCKILYEQVENVCAKSKHRKVQYYCIAEDQERNLEAALAILHFLEDKDRQIQKNNYIFLFSKDPSLELMIDSVDKGLVEIDIINEYQMASYRLLEQYPLFHAATKDKQIPVLICGFGEMAQEFLRAVSWVGQLPGYKLSITVLGKNIDDAVADFRAAYPALVGAKYNIRYLSYTNEEHFRSILDGQCAQAKYIMVGEETERLTIDKAVFLRRYFYRTDDKFNNAPRIFAYIENADRASAVANLRTPESKPERRMPYNIVPFGMVTETYTYQNITDSDLEKMSKNVHLVYEDIFSDGPIDALEAMTRYNSFEVNKRSNKANALHIRYKLLLLGLDYTDADSNETEADLEQALNDATMEKLMIAEHDRWMAFLESEGWSAASISQVQAYQASGISKGRHNCPILRMHPYICPYEELPDRSEQLGLPDSTVYDRELIRRIPDILHDKWGVSGKRYKIISVNKEMEEQ